MGIVADDYERCQRLVDIVGASTILAATSPVLAVLLIVTKAIDRGPAIYRRKVVARGGGTFDAFKIRTMVVNADALLESDPDLQRAYEANVKLWHDPRVTRLGRTLRRLSLDELPQLLNVLRGEMSLVGPRMIHPSELERFGEFGALRCSVRPGITGLWQVSGRSALTYNARIRLDREYLARRSCSYDLRILIRTLFEVLARRGAA